MDKAWAGLDVGKEFHWAHLLDASGRELLSRKVENDEADILKLIDEVLLLSLIGQRDCVGSRPARRWRSALAGTAVGAKPESSLHSRPQRGSSPRHLPRGVQNRCP